jgi:hypothetical protein
MRKCPAEAGKYKERQVEDLFAKRNALFIMLAAQQQMRLKCSD